MRERGLADRPDGPAPRRGTSPAATVRYALAWVAATTAILVALSIVLRGNGEPPGSLSSAVERASCRLERGGGEAARGIGAALDAGKIVVRHRATLGAAERVRLRQIVRRLAGRAITVPGAPTSAAAVEATGEIYRLGCPRVDRRTEEALIVFTLLLDGAR